jgi:hypothetical protein
MPEHSLSLSPDESEAALSQRWLLKHNERIYGPYSFDAMRRYIAEGRVAARSIIAPEGTLQGADAWMQASSIAEFAPLFGMIPAPALASVVAPIAAPASVAELVSQTEAQPAAQQQRPVYGPSKGQTDRRRQIKSANFIIVMDVKSRYAGPLEQAIMSTGPAYKLAPNVWCVNAEGTAAGLLNTLSQHIGKLDSMFVMDATRDRGVWFNLGPESEAKLRRVLTHGR